MPARRLAIAFLLCLLGGVVVSYGTSWYAVCRFHEEDLDEVAGDRVDPAPEDWPVPPPGNWPALEAIRAEETHPMFALTRRSGRLPIRLTTWRADTQVTGYQIHEVRSGWPAYAAATYECVRNSMLANALAPAGTTLSRWYRGLHAADRTFSRPFGPRTTYTQAIMLPLCPLWPGLAINSAIFGSTLFAVTLTFGPVRRVIRRRRGLCEHCTYPLGPSPVCTECGRPVARASESEGKPARSRSGLF